MAFCGKDNLLYSVGFSQPVRVIYLCKFLDLKNNGFLTFNFQPVF